MIAAHANVSTVDAVALLRANAFGREITIDGVAAQLTGGESSAGELVTPE